MTNGPTMILDRLEGVKPSGRDQWAAKCPAHKDKKPSLSIGLGEDGRVLLHCHAGCEVKDIVAAVNLTEADLFPAPATPHPRATVIATYNYTDAEGTLLYQVLRKSDKTFVQRRPDGRGGWIWDMKDTTRVLYNLPYLLGYPMQDWVFVVEGEKDVDNLRLHNLAGTTNSGGAGKWPMVADLSALHDRRVAIIPDNDDVGREHARQVALSLYGKVKELKIVTLPNVPAKGDVSDWLATFDGDNLNGPYFGIRDLAMAAPDFVPEAKVVGVADWPQPQPIPEDLPSVKSFDPALLPEAVRPWIVDITERMQCPIEFPAAAAIIALAGMIGRKASIRPMKLDDWTEFPNLWGMLIGRPSLMKSPPMKQILQPIRRLTTVARAEFEAALRVYLQQVELAGLETKQAKRKVEAAMAKGRDVEVLSDHLVPNLPEKPKRRRYTVNDTTVEALAEILSENPHGVLLERDEMMGFLQALDRAGQEGARAFYLECWAGNGHFESDRIGRGNTHISGACLSVLGTIQPGPLGTYLHEAIRGGTGDDGLMQRFQLSVWPDDPGDWQVVDRLPDNRARDRAFEVFIRLENLNAAAVGGEIDRFDDSGVPFFRFDEAAQERFYAWRTRWENYCRHSDHHPAMESHLAKFRKLIPALALIIHLADGHDGAIGDDALERAVGWGEVLESHAKKIYSRGLDPAVAHARALAKRIVAGDVAETFTLREIYRNHWSLLDDNRQAQLAAEELVALGWLRAEQQVTGGRPTVIHRINPAARTMRF